MALRFYSFILITFLSAPLFSWGAPIQCARLFEVDSPLSYSEVPLAELTEQFTKTYKALEKLELDQADKADVYTLKLVAMAKEFLGRKGVAYTVDPQDPQILLIDPIKGKKGQNIAQLNILAHAHTQVFRVHGMTEDDYTHPLLLEYNPKMLFKESSTALYSDPRGRLSLSHTQILAQRYDELLAHEDTHAEFFYKEMSGVENHLQGFISKSPHLKPINPGYEHDFHFDELAAYTRQVIFSLQSGKPKAEVRAQAQTGIDLAQSILHQDLTQFVNQDLPAINAHGKGWITKRIRKNFWGEVRPGILVSNSKSLSKIFMFEAPLVELADAVKAELTAAQIQKIESKKNLYFVMDLKYHYVIMRMQGPINFENRVELLARLEQKLRDLRATAKAVKEGFVLVQQNLDRRNPEAALKAALALKPYIQVLNDNTRVVATPL